MHKYNEIDKEDINKDYLEEKVLNNSEQIDEDERNEALEDAGLDPDDFDF